MFRLLGIPLIKYIKTVASTDLFNKDNDLYFTKQDFALKLRNKFSY